MRSRSSPSLALLAALAFLPSAPSSAQEVVDTITVEVYGEPDAIAVEGPLRGYVGDTLLFRYELVDEEGEPTIGVVTWEVRDPDRGAIVAETDSTVSVELLERGPLVLIANVARLTALVIGGEYLSPYDSAGEVVTPVGTFQWGGPFRTNPGDSLQLCAVGVVGDALALASSSRCAQEFAALSGALFEELDVRTAELREAFSELEPPRGTLAILVLPGLWPFRNYPGTGGRGIPSRVRAGA